MGESDETSGGGGEQGGAAEMRVGREAAAGGEVGGGWLFHPGGSLCINLGLPNTSRPLPPLPHDK